MLLRSPLWGRREVIPAAGPWPPRRFRLGPIPSAGGQVEVSGQTRTTANGSSRRKPRSPLMSGLRTARRRTRRGAVAQRVCFTALLAWLIPLPPSRTAAAGASACRKWVCTKRAVQVRARPRAICRTDPVMGRCPHCSCCSAMGRLPPPLAKAWQALVFPPGLLHPRLTAGPVPMRKTLSATPGQITWPSRLSDNPAAVIALLSIDPGLARWREPRCAGGGGTWRSGESRGIDRCRTGLVASQRCGRGGGTSTAGKASMQVRKNRASRSDISTTGRLLRNQGCPWLHPWCQRSWPAALVQVSTELNAPAPRGQLRPTQTRDQRQPGCHCWRWWDPVTVPRQRDYSGDHAMPQR